MLALCGARSGRLRGARHSPAPGRRARRALTLAELSRRCSSTRRRWPWGRRGSTTTATTRPATGRPRSSGAARARVRAGQGGRGAHPRRGGRHRCRPRRAPGGDARGPPLLLVAACSRPRSSTAGTCRSPGTSPTRRRPSCGRAAARVPRERLLAETDSPYLAPQPVRGSANEPAYVVHTLAGPRRSPRRRGPGRRSSA